jgi:hypothetical protein
MNDFIGFGVILLMVMAGLLLIKWLIILDCRRKEIEVRLYGLTFYTEEEVKQLIEIAWATASAYGENTGSADCDDWFEHNKKKPYVDRTL